MTQVNDETGNHRPVILALKCMEKETTNFAATSTPIVGGGGATVSITENPTTPVETTATTTETTTVPAIIKPQASVPETPDDAMDTSPQADLEAKFPGA